MDDPGLEERRRLLHSYIARWEGPSAGTSPLDHVRNRLSPATRHKMREAATTVLAPLERKKASRYPLPVKLHLGSGRNHLAGWVNVDLAGQGADLSWDIRHPLPFPPDSAEAVFMEHVLEHVSYSDALRVLGHVRLVLRPGGILRVGVPDAGLYARSYVDDGEGFIERERPGRPTKMLALREAFQQYGHVSAYDAETLVLVMDEGGFPGAEIMAPSVSRLDPAPDLERRWSESVYAEVVT
ncbi:MAG TPA: methyltransferase domain-containing protein [Acidimicrobiales bacterium]|nr:methyltransferase domain-containing protein [Acidimicrobiales bacterium]